MNAQSTLSTPRPIKIIAAALATVIALSVLLVVATLFQSRGAPLEQLARAERVCAHSAYQSERQACMNKWIADSQATIIAAR